MATNLGSSAMQTEDEEQWLYGGDTGNQEDGPTPGDTGPHHLKDIPKEKKTVSDEERELLQQVQQGRTRNAEKEPDFKADLMALVGGQVKVGPPPNRKLSGTIDVIGGEPGTIRRVEGRRRDKNGPEENSIQVLGDNGSKAHPTKSLQQLGPHQPLVPPTGPPPPVGGSPPSCFFLPWMPVTSSPPLRHHPGMPPPAPVPGLLPPPHASPPPLSILTHDGQSASYNNSQPPPFGYNSTASGFISYPPISTSHMPWMTTASSICKSSHWEHSGSRGERDCDWTSATREYNDDERDHYYSREGSSNFEQDYHSRDNSWEREYHHWEQRHRDRDKEEAGKHNHGVNSMRAKKVKATGVTSTKRTSTTRKEKA